MTNEQIKKLDGLRDEKRKLESFLSGNGHLGVKKTVTKITLFKDFGCGEHELYCRDDLKYSILEVIRDRLDEVVKEIEDM